MVSLPRPTTSRVLLVRHCESSGPEPDAPLTSKGEAQALALTDRLTSLGIDHIVSSPFLRARQTIDVFARRRNLTVCVDDRLAERRLAPQRIPTWREEIRKSFADLDHVLPGGEPARSAQRRGRAAIDALLAAGHRLALASTHGQLMSLVLHSIDPSFGFAQWRELTFPDVYVIELDVAGLYRFHRLSERRARADNG
jgi:2,3-bisphosphoglycerate-dependent phosphoglycerate mutase